MKKSIPNFVNCPFRHCFLLSVTYLITGEMVIQTKKTVTKRLKAINCSNNSGNLLDFPRATTKIVEEETTSINSKKISSSITFSSSPVKKYNDIRNITDDSCSYDFSQIESYKTKKPEIKTSIELLLQDNNVNNKKTYFSDVNEKVTNLFKKLETNRIIDLNLHDISFGTAEYHSKESVNKRLVPKQFTFRILYNKSSVESIIEVENLANNKKQTLVNQLKEKLINSQTGKRKHKVIILTPRINASWFQRKLKTSNIKVKNNSSEFIIVKVKKSCIRFLKDCINEL